MYNKLWVSRQTLRRLMVHGTVFFGLGLELPAVLAATAEILWFRPGIGLQC